jgi:hypothetical protein
VECGSCRQALEQASGACDRSAQASAGAAEPDPAEPLRRGLTAFSSFRIDSFPRLNSSFLIFHKRKLLENFILPKLAALVID